MRKRLLVWLFPFLALSAVLLAGITAAPALAAGEVTDTITVKVGYYGMNEEDYVEAGTYTWGELEQNLEMHEVVYSYYNDANSAWTHDGTYSVTEAEGYGFYVEDLLDYANVSVNSVESIDFYTKDRDTGYRCYFTANDLFWNSYYFFDNLQQHLTFLRDEDGNLLYDEYNHMQTDNTEAWNYAVRVKPMLALESSWQNSGELSADEEYSFSFDPSENMSPASRFRLLFGQSSPSDSGNQSRSAKYVHTLYVTLVGTTVYGEGIPDFDTTVGAHTFEITMTSGDAALLTAMEELVGFESSDNTVLNITGWSAVKSSEFSDVTTITVSYEVLKEGTVTVLATGAAAQTLSGEAQTSRTVETTAAADAADDTGSTDGSAEETDPNGGANTGGETKQTDAAGQTASSVMTEQTETDEEDTGVAAAGVGTQPAVMSSQTMYAVSDSLKQALKKHDEPMVKVFEPEEDVEILEVQESTLDEKYLTWTGAGALGLCLLGGLCAAGDYVWKRRR